MNCRRMFVFVLICFGARALQAAQKLEVRFPASLHASSITGRIFVALSQSPSPEPIRMAGSSRGGSQFFGIDVRNLEPGKPVSIDDHTPGFPEESLSDLPAGDYYAQPLVNVYTEFHRADGHTIFAHMDQWEGQQFNRSPGNLIGEPKRVHIDPAASETISLEVSRVIPPIDMPADTAWVKHVKIQSAMLTKFWGRPIYLGATVLLPKGYEEHQEQSYPVVYHQFHFDLNAPFGFTETAGSGRGARGFQFYQQWTRDDFPRLITVTFQHPTPFYDDSYAVNSANNGPYGDALTQELIPYLEQHFRMIRQPWARALTGGSTGGWEALALKLFHPELFGAAWVFCPDPVDFRKYGLVNIYNDENAFEAPGGKQERPMMRTPEGQVTMTVRQSSRLERVLGTRGRSGEQLNAWEAVYGPPDAEGYPRALWNKESGKIDRETANYMKEHGFDLTAYIRNNWPRLEPSLKGRLHFYVGDMDSYFLNLAVYQLEDFLKTTTAGATFEYGRPLKGHMWYPMTNAELVTMIFAEMRRSH